MTSMMNPPPSEPNRNPTMNEELLPKDGDDELTVTEKRAKRYRRQQTKTNSDVKKLEYFVQGPQAVSV
jgi:hypothetical protein